ncbi:MAG: DUF192 domain-containing protein, partial [bacterium]
MKRYIFFAIFLLCLSLGLYLTIESKSNPTKVCFGSNCFLVEVVDTVEKRQRGLMFRESLDKNKGMLFVFDGVGEYDFWMKNTLISLDIIWLNENYKVVGVQTAVPCEAGPCSHYSPNALAQYV